MTLQRFNSLPMNAACLMKTAIISDIHGNLQALQAVLTDIDRQGITDIISLGDNIGYGPEPEEVFKTLTARGIPSLMGNHELALIQHRSLLRLNPSAQRSLEITRTLISAETLAALSGLDLFWIRGGVRFVHASPPQSVTAYILDLAPSSLDKIFSSFPERIAFFGHTHTLQLFEHNHPAMPLEQWPPDLIRLNRSSRYLVNCGSVGQPRDMLNNLAKYITWDREEETIEIHGVPYAVETTIENLTRLGFPSFNAERLRA